MHAACVSRCTATVNLPTMKAINTAAKFLFLIALLHGYTAESLYVAVCNHNNADLTLQCPDNQRIQIIGVYFGRTAGWNFDWCLVPDPTVDACRYLDEDKTEDLRIVCNSQTNCSQYIPRYQTVFSGFDPCEDWSGNFFVNASFNCVSSDDGESVIPSQNLGAATMVDFTGSQVMLQSSQYPSNPTSTSSITCSVQISSASRITETIYDLSSNGYVYIQPHCYYSQSPSVCTSYGDRVNISDLLMSEDRSLTWTECQTTVGFRGRFWLQLKVQLDSGGNGELKIKCPASSDVDSIFTDDDSVEDLSDSCIETNTPVVAGTASTTSDPSAAVTYHKISQLAWLIVMLSSAIWCL